MLTPDDMIKMALETPTDEDKRTPARKLYDSTATGVANLAGGLVAGAAGLGSLDKLAPPKVIE